MAHRGPSRVPCVFSTNFEIDSMSDSNSELPAVQENPDSTSAAADATAASPQQRERLEQVRRDLLRVHRALLEVERKRYEKVKGRVPNNATFLQVVINDPWFDWLRPMAQLVLLIDERMGDPRKPLASDEARSLFDRSRALLRADAEGDAFQRLYYESIQNSPDLAVLARQVAGGLGSI